MSTLKNRSREHIFATARERMNKIKATLQCRHNESREGIGKKTRNCDITLACASVIREGQSSTQSVRFFTFTCHLKTSDATEFFKSPIYSKFVECD